MTDRPIPALAGVAAAVFVAGFSAAAVTRPEDITAAVAAAKTAPADIQENTRLASLVTPALTEVAALPALHLPKVVHHHHHHKKKHHAKKKTSHVAHVTVKAPAVRQTPTPAATPVPTVAPVYHAPAPKQTSKPKSGGYVGSHFDSKG
jgi:hypothetical protein